MASPSENPDEEPLVLPQPEELAAVLPDYEVSEFVAQGGMGAIYRGEQIKLERPVAIKILPRSFGSEFDYTERFEREAKAMAKLSHNNIVSVYDYGETTDGAFLFFVMEFIEGSNLHQLLLNGPIEVDQAIAVLSQVCSGLQYAHEHGIIHRDIKPSNILVDQRGTVKMTDFGLAKVTHGRGAAAFAAEEDEATVMGTPEYIAPEALIEGVAVDYRADIFSVGVLIYEVLTGQLPTQSHPYPSQVRPVIDQRFDEIVKKAMMPDREARFQRVNDINSILTDVGKVPRLITGSKKPKRKARTPRPLRTMHAPAPVKRKVAIPHAKATHPVAASRPKSRHKKPAQAPPTAAMVAVGVAFLVIVLIGVISLWIKSRSQDSKPKSPPTEIRETP